MGAEKNPRGEFSCKRVAKSSKRKLTEAYADECSTSKRHRIHRRVECARNAGCPTTSQQTVEKDTSTTTRKTSRSIDHDDDELKPLHSTPIHASSLAEMVQMSPKKALRVAQLRLQFADIIFRSKHSDPLKHGNKSGPELMRERAKLEQEKMKEKRKLEAEVKAIESIAQKEPRANAREASRMALEMMKKTVEHNDNGELLKDLVSIGCGYLCGSVNDFGAAAS